MNRGIAALLFVVCAAWNSNPTWAACVGPGISVTVTRETGAVVVIGTGFTTADGVRIQSTPSLAPGASVTVTGSGLMDGCHDVCINGVCPPTFPARGIRVLFVQGERTVELGKVDADSSFRISYKASLPADARSGEATIVVETLYGGRWTRTRPVTFTVTEQAEVR